MKRVWTLLLVMFFAGAESESPALDANSNQLSDVWESRYSIDPGADPAADSDGDGQMLFQEAQFGTDPGDPNSRTQAYLQSGAVPDALILSVGTQTGKRYRIESNGDLAVWSALGEEFTGDGTTMEVMGLLLDSLSPERQFFRVAYAGDRRRWRRPHRLGGTDPRHERSNCRQ